MRQFANRVRVSSLSRSVCVVAALVSAAAWPHSAEAQSDIVVRAAAAERRVGSWTVQSDSSAIERSVIRHPDRGAGKITTARTSPTDYFEITFQAQAGTPYRLWLRGKADRDHWGNDSVFVQFDRSVTSSGAAAWRIGTTSAAEVNLESCAGCGIAGWVWQDNGYGRNVLGPTIRFSASGTQRLRVQTREDGLAIDQIILSPSRYLTSAPTLSAGSTGTSSSTTATDVVLHPAYASTRAGRWAAASDGSAVDGRKMRHPNAGASKIVTAQAQPSNYFELTFSAVAGIPYRLWLHGRADNDSWANDSVFVQFSGSLTSSGSAAYRIGTTSAAEVNLEECSGCGLRGWQWQDNGWGRGVLGPAIYFQSTGRQTLRVQTREDGLSIDRILLSPAAYLRSVPPAPPASTSTTSTSTTTSTTSTSTTTTTSTTAGSSTTLKVLEWNIHHGIGTDGRYDLQRFVTHIVRSGANVVSLNEVEKYVGSYGNENQPARFAALLKSATGKNWYYNFAHRTGGTNGQGNLLLTSFPIEDASDYRLSYDRSVARVQILVNGIRVNVFSTHLDASSSSRRATQMHQLKSWASSFSQQWIFAGDFNAWPGASEIGIMTASNYDAWAVAKAAGTAVAYPGNEAGNTRNSRIDYVFYSKAATRLRLTQARVFDVRDSRGVMPSDHRPVMATFQVGS